MVERPRRSRALVNCDGVMLAVEKDGQSSSLPPPTKILYHIYLPTHLKGQALVKIARQARDRPLPSLALGSRPMVMPCSGFVSRAAAEYCRCRFRSDKPA